VLFVSFVSDMRVSDYQPKAAAGLSLLIPKEIPTYENLVGNDLVFELLLRKYLSSGY